MAPRERIGRIAVASLGLALALVFAGKAIEFTHVAPFLGLGCLVGLLLSGT